MPQQNHAVSRGRQQYQPPPPPPPQPTIKDNIDTTAQMVGELLDRMTNMEAKFDKIVQYLQNKQNQTLVNTIQPTNNLTNLLE